jgi:DNA polymerase
VTFNKVVARQHRQLGYLESLGIPVWVPRDFQAPKAQTLEIPAVQQQEVIPEIRLSESPADTAQLDWSSLSQMVAGCTDCGLHTGRTQAVFGVGNQDADIMVIGEAPGADEDKQGEPFVGRAGKLLDEMLCAIKHPRDSVYIANIVKCRPPENRNPQQEEALRCAPYLHRQIELVSPRVMLAVGKVAAQNLLQTDLPIGKMRGNQYHYAALNIPVIVTYHPAYLLRSPREKAKVWQDLKLLKALLE